MLAALVVTFVVVAIAVALARAGSSPAGAYSRSRGQLREDLGRPSRWLPPLVLIIVFFVRAAVSGSGSQAALGFAALVVVGFMAAVWWFGRR